MKYVLTLMLALAGVSAGAATLSLTAFQYPGSRYTAATGINDRGDIVGYYTDASGASHGFERTAAGTLSPIDYAPQSGNSSSTIPRAINDAGQIVGSYNGYPYNAFLRDPDGSLHSVLNAEFSGIAENGLISGFTLAGFQDFLIDAAGKYTYFTVPYIVPPYISAFAWGVNASGVVVGSYTGVVENGAGVGSFIRDASGKFSRFNLPGGATIANSINDSGVIAGYVGTQGFVRSPDGSFQLIDFAGASNTALYGINNSGQVVGSATLVNGITEAIVSAPDIVSTPANVPEPGGWLAVATGLMVFASRARRRR